MLEVMQFIFSSFWVFIGTLLLMGVLVKGVVALAAVLFSKADVTIN